VRHQRKRPAGRFRAEFMRERARRDEPPDDTTRAGRTGQRGRPRLLADRQSHPSWRPRPPPSRHRACVCVRRACLPACRAACAARWIASRERRAAAGTGRRRRRAGRVRVGIRLVREPGGFIPAGACGSRAVVALLGGGEDGRTRIGARLIALSAASPGTAILSLSLSRSGTNDCRLVW